MLKRENDFDKDDKMEAINSKYNLEELFNTIVLNKEEKTDKRREK